jgi:hypothetical protein
MKGACESLRAQPKDTGPVTVIAEAIREWRALAASLIELEAHKGRDDERARELFGNVRSLAIDLANNHQRYDVALSLTTIALDVFSGLPRAAEQLKEDIPLLEERLADAALEPLRQWIANLGDDLVLLVADLQSHGFGEGSIKETKELFDLFLNSVAVTQATKLSDLPWMIVRDVAIRLNNGKETPRAALALTIGLLQRAKTRFEAVSTGNICSAYR